jgi:hypothetical protein
MPNPMLKGAVKALIPKVTLPRYFKITSTIHQEGTALSLKANVDGELKEYDAKLTTPEPRLADILGLFPSIDLENDVPKMVRGFVGAIPLPRVWTLECGPAEGGVEFSLDIPQADGSIRHWAKKLEVSAAQLADLIDVIDWVRESNKIDRHAGKR